MSSKRQIQVAEAVQQYMSELLQRVLKDPRIGFATVTKAEMSHDLRYARVYISVMGSPDEQRGTMDALESGKGFIRRELGGRLGLRFVPEIQFKLDSSAEYSDRINRLMDEVRREDETRQAALAAQAQAQPVEENEAPGEPAQEEQE